MANKKNTSPKPKPVVKKKTIDLDLVDEIIFRVDGEEEKNHTLSWDIFKKIADNTQALINKLALYSVETEKTIDPLNLKLVVTGFYAGSACPGLKIANNRTSLFSKENNLKALNSDFAKVVSLVNAGNFKAIVDNFDTPEIKNDVLETVYDWTNSAGTKKFQIVKKTNGDVTKWAPIARIRQMKPEQKTALKIYIPEDKSNKPSTETEAVGQVLLKVSQKGRKSTKVKQLYTQKNAALSLRFDSIETQNRIYSLKGEQLFSFIEDPKKHWVTIENSLLDIYAHGKTMQLAQEDLFDQFDYTYQRLNQIPDNQLSEHLLEAKNYINMIVRTVKDK